MTILVLDAQTGISGDMTVAALLDLGADFQKLQTVLKSLPDQQFKISVSRVTKSALDACDFKVTLTNGADNNDHDMNYLFGDACQMHQEHSHSHDHGHEHEHEHNHCHDHGAPHHHHEHRHLSDIFRILDQTVATDQAKSLAKRIFTIVAEAESKAHGVPIEEVHFHEVGALDSIVDILSVAVLIDALNVDRVIVTALGEGYGEVRCQHGILPVPVPAVSHIAESYGLTLSRIDCKGEFVTPTGAAIVAALKTSDELPNRYKILKSGLGAGKRDYSRPSLLRASLIQACDNRTEKDRVIELSTNIDDSSAETLGFTLQQLYANGALEAWFTPVFMKKCRPAYILSVLCQTNKQELLENIIFSNTTTIGIRSREVSRRILKRKKLTVQTSFGPVDVKACEVPDYEGVFHTRYYPEYESAKEVAQKQGIDLPTLYRVVQEAAENA